MNDQFNPPSESQEDILASLVKAYGKPIYNCCPGYNSAGDFAQWLAERVKGLQAKIALLEKHNQELLAERELHRSQEKEPVTWGDIIDALGDGTLQTITVAGCKYIINPDAPLIADSQYVCDKVREAKKSRQEQCPVVESILDKETSRIEDVEYVSDATIMGYLRSARVILESARQEFFRTHYRFEEVGLADKLENAICQVKQMFLDFAMQCEKKVQEAKGKGKNNEKNINNRSN